MTVQRELKKKQKALVNVYENATICLKIFLFQKNIINIAIAHAHLNTSTT